MFPSEKLSSLFNVNLVKVRFSSCYLEANVWFFLCWIRLFWHIYYWVSLKNDFLSEDPFPPTRSSRKVGAIFSEEWLQIRKYITLEASRISWGLVVCNLEEKTGVYWRLNKPDLGKQIKVAVPYMGQVESTGPDHTPNDGSCGFP